MTMEHSYCHSAVFEKAIHVAPIDAHTYSANLDPEWCIAHVPHGGYTSSILYRAASTHFKHNAKKYRFPPTATPEPIGFQINFLRRTAVGPAIIRIEDIKIGAQISTIHVTLLQRPDRYTSDDDLEVKVVAYITLSPPSIDQDGPVVKGTWGFSPVPPAGSRPDGSIDFAALAETGTDGAWRRLPRPARNFSAPRQVDIYAPRMPFEGTLEARTKQVIDQWARFIPGGDSNARWSNEALIFLADIMPAGIDRLGAMEMARLIEAGQMQEDVASANERAAGGAFWYPTVTMNIDLKSRLPPEGVEWLHSRVVTRTLRGSRADLDVVITDRNGDVVATSTHVALVVDATRNSKGRTKL